MDTSCVALIDPTRARGLDTLPSAAWKTAKAESLAGQTIFLTGATGFVGRWVIAAVGRLNQSLDRPIAITALTRGERPVEAPWLNWVEGDVRTLDPTALPKADFVLHAALSSSATPPGGDQELLDTAIAGMSRCLSFAQRAGAKRMLVLSSGSVYGTAYAPLTESSPLAELEVGDTYGAAKREVEKLALAPAMSGRVTVARLFTCIGHGYRRHNHLAHVSMIADARAGKPIILRSDGSAVRSYLFGADLAVWLLALLAGKESGVFNVGNDEAVTMLEFARMIAHASGRDDSAVEVRGTDPVVRPVFVPDITRARSSFGVAPWTSVRTAIAQAMATG